MERGPGAGAQALGVHRELQGRRETEEGAGWRGQLLLGL